METVALDKLIDEIKSFRRLIENLTADAPKRDDIESIRRLMEIQARDALRKELELVATTEERKRVYVLIDGLSSTEEISRKSGLSVRSVQDIVKKFSDMDLITSAKRGFPRRRFEWVPSTWRIEREA